MSSKVDWEAVEKEYRANQLSVREIGRRYGVSDKAIRNKAKSNGWQRDLGDEVSKRARMESVRTEVRTANASYSEEEVVQQFAQRSAEVEQMQRGQMGRLLALGEALLEEVQTAELDLPKRTSCYRDLSQAAARLIPLQRQMYRLDEQESDESYEAQLRRLAESDG